MFKQAYINGFLSKCAANGLSDEEMQMLLQRLAVDNAVNSVPDTPQNDFKSGIGDTFRDLYIDNETLAHKQRRFEEEYNKKRWLSKALMRIKHPRRSRIADEKFKGRRSPVGKLARAAALVLAGGAIGSFAHKRFTDYKNRKLTELAALGGATNESTNESKAEQ